mmetsp:Transcript_139604/g.246501  ORF Transcript_139604/g.246501 Transcript_139604/m.246501 type:complete len:275 (-) Transcript_139604:129-953(-)
MGQKMSDECGCQVFESMCGPQDPAAEQAGTVQTGYPNPSISERGTAGYTTTATSEESSPQRPQQGNYGAEEQAPFFGAPPPDDASSPIAAPPPMNSETPSRGAAGREVSADDILSNLEGSEEVLYGDAFSSFPGGATSFVTLDCLPMRDFLVTNSCISMDDLDLELLKVAQTDDGLSRDGFLQLLREFAVSDSDSLGQFMGLSSNGESLAADECRSGLLLFCQQKLSTNFSDDRWDCIFNAILWDAGITVDMEKWCIYCKTTARMVRLLRYAQL